MGETFFGGGPGVLCENAVKKCYFSRRTETASGAEIRPAMAGTQVCVCHLQLGVGSQTVHMIAGLAHSERRQIRPAIRSEVQTGGIKSPWATGPCAKSAGKGGEFFARQFGEAPRFRRRRSPLTSRTRCHRAHRWTEAWTRQGNEQCQVVRPRLQFGPCANRRASKPCFGVRKLISNGRGMCVPPPPGQERISFTEFVRERKMGVSGAVRK